MSDVEEIETLSFKTQPRPSWDPFLMIRYTYTESNDGIISEIRFIDGYAIINGKPCVPGRRFTKASFQKIEKRLLDIMNTKHVGEG